MIGFPTVTSVYVYSQGQSFPQIADRLFDFFRQSRCSLLCGLSGVEFHGLMTLRIERKKMEST